MQGMLGRQLKGLLDEFQAAQQDYKIKSRQRIERQIKIVKPNYSQQDVDSAMDGHAEQIFAGQIMASTSHAMAVNALADVQERHQDIVKLERSITQLHQLFVELSVIVGVQGDVIDHMLVTTADASARTLDGVNAITRATTGQRKSRRKLFIMGALLLLLFLIILGVVGPVISRLHL